MDSIFGIGLPELIVILLVAGLILGPQQVAQVARHLGRLIGRLRVLFRQMIAATRQIGADLDAREDFREAQEELRALQKEVAALRHELNQARQEISGGGPPRPAARPVKAADDGKSSRPAPATANPNLPQLREVADDPDD